MTKGSGKFLRLYWAATSLDLALAALGKFKGKINAVSLLDVPFLFSCLTHAFGYSCAQAVIY